MREVNYYVLVECHGGVGRLSLSESHDHLLNQV